MRSARSLFLVVVVASLALVPAGGADAARRFTFYGSGWGHGVGLSQWGAYGLAQEGWGPRRILTHFYSGTAVRRASRAIRPDKIRVGIAQGRPRVHLVAESAPVGLRIGSLHGRLIGRIAPGQTWTVGLRGGRFVIRGPAGRPVGGRSWGGPETHVYVRYAASGAVVRVPETGHSYRRGWIEVGQHGCACLLHLVAVVSP